MSVDAADVKIQDVFAALVTDEVRNEFIVRGVIGAVESGRSPLVLTSRTDHLRRLESALAGKVRNVIVLKGGMGRKQRRSLSAETVFYPISSRHWGRCLSESRFLRLL